MLWAPDKSSAQIVVPRSSGGACTANFIWNPDTQNWYLLSRVATGSFSTAMCMSTALNGKRAAQSLDLARGEPLGMFPNQKKFYPNTTYNSATSTGTVKYLQAPGTKTSAAFVSTLEQ